MAYHEMYINILHTVLLKVLDAEILISLVHFFMLPLSQRFHFLVTLMFTNFLNMFFMCVPFICPFFRHTFFIFNFFV